MQVDLEVPSTEVLERAAQVIREGGVVFYPADTVYGLGCSPFSIPALERIYALKRRPTEKGFLVLIPELGWLERLITGDRGLVERLARRFWPGPLTLLCPASPELPGQLTGDDGKIGVRLPRSLFLRNWMEKVPGPIVSTSANLSGQKMPAEIEEFRTLFEPYVDLFLEASEPLLGQASTVLDLCRPTPVVLRRGPLAAEVETFLG